jgi:uncharacterized protein YjiS (DUF1127 family)
MSVFTLEDSPRTRRSFLAASLIGLRARTVASWKRHRAEKALAGLSYETLKDIGFPVADGSNKNTPTR